METPATSLQELFRLSFSEPFRWLAGENLAAGSVQWVATSLAEAHEGDLLLLNAEKIHTDFLVQAARRGVSGVVLLGEPGFEQGEIPSGLPVVCVQDPDGISSVQRLLLTVLINQRAAVIERGIRIHTQLSQLEAEGAGLEGLARAMADLSGRGILIQDKRGQVLASCPSPTLNALWGDIQAQLRPLSSLPEQFLDRKQAGKLASLVEQEIPGGLVRLVGPITVSEVARGYLSVVSLHGELDSLDQLVARHGSMVCAIEMARHKAIREAEKRLGGDLLGAVLEEALTPRDAALWAQMMGLDLAQAHVVLRFAWEGQNPPSRRRLETLINQVVAQNGMRAIVRPMGSEVICICQIPAEENRPQAALDAAALVIVQGQQEYPGVPLRCGVGSQVAEISAWRTSFRQAGEALEMARRLEEDRPQFYPDLSIYRLLFQIEHNPELSAFQEETLGPLLAQENSQELLHTLEVYFQHHGNISQTAEALFVHRNTLIYRMERIVGILHQNLDDPETRLALQLALYIHRMNRKDIKR